MKNTKLRMVEASSVPVGERFPGNGKEVDHRAKLPNELNAAARRMLRALELAEGLRAAEPDERRALNKLLDNAQLHPFWMQVQRKFSAHFARRNPRFTRDTASVRLMYLYSELLAVLIAHHFPIDNLGTIKRRRAVITKQLRAALKSIQADGEVASFDVKKLLPDYCDPDTLTEQLQRPALKFSELLRMIIDNIEQGRPLSVFDPLSRARHFPSKGQKNRRQNFIEQTLYEIFKKELGSRSCELIAMALEAVLNVECDPQDIGGRCRNRRPLA